jgi:AraC-like DNA-binding protein
MTRLNQGGSCEARDTADATPAHRTGFSRANAWDPRINAWPKAMAYIHEHFAQPITRKELAGYVGFSERHLNRCFLQETGMTPLAYLNRYRIHQARKLLEQGRLSITETIGRVGFSESSHFTRLFSREVGVSPRRLRRGNDRLTFTLAMPLEYCTGKITITSCIGKLHE